jgi:argininosuccinate lyase
VARELGFRGPTQNSMDAVADRDFACEILSALAIIGMHLSRLSEDVILWCSTEFGYLRLSDAHTTGSSLMPQKKNPDIAELTRGKSGRLLGNLVALFTAAKGLPLTYNRDLQEDKEPLFDSLDTVRACLPLLAEMFQAAEVNEAAAAQAVADPLLLATDLADLLVRRGVPFRQAHEQVGKLVACSEKAGLPLPKLPEQLVREVAPAAVEGYAEVFELSRAMAARRAPGCPAPERVEERLAWWRRHLQKTEETAGGWK